MGSYVEFTVEGSAFGKHIEKDVKKRKESIGGGEQYENQANIHRVWKSFDAQSPIDRLPPAKMEGRKAVFELHSAVHPCCRAACIQKSSTIVAHPPPYPPEKP